MITIERLKEVLDYNPETGWFTWVSFMSPRAAAGSLAGCDYAGYRKIQIDGSAYLAHRLAWFYMMSAWPKEEIDHINHDRSDNRFKNLREASPSQNQWNRGKSTNNTSGFKGVSFYRPTGKWVAYIGCKGVKARNLGYYDTPEKAAEVYRQTAQKLHGEFACF